MGDEEVRAVQVRKSLYTGLKSKITINLKTLERYFQDYQNTQTVVKSAEEKAALKTPLKNCDDALDQWDRYIIQHSAYEVRMQDENEDFVDADLELQKSDRDKYEEKVGIAKVKINRLCSDYNVQVNTRVRQNSQGAVVEARAKTPPPQIITVPVEDEYKINDSIKPDKLSQNATMFVFLNWNRAIEAYFAINKMDKKDQKIQVATLFGCLDEPLKKMLTVNFKNLPDVPVISNEPESYQQALVNFFNDKYPLPIRINDFFMEQQRPNEPVTDFAQRCEGLAIAGQVQELQFDAILKYKIVTGLIHAPVLRAKLLRKLTDPEFDSLKLKREIAEYEASEKCTNAIDKFASSSVNNLSQYRQQQTQFKLDNYRQRGQAPFPIRNQRPFAPRQPFQNQRPTVRFNQPRSTTSVNACRTCGFVPFFNCQHYKNRGQPRNRQPNFNQRRHMEIQANSRDLEHDSDDNFVNTISNVYFSLNAIELDPDVQPVTHVRELPRDDHGLPVMPNQRQTPLIYAFVREDKRRYPNPNDRSVFFQVHTPITEALCLPDTGAASSVIHPDLARQCSLTIDQRDNVSMYAANGQRLNCLGSVKIQISFFGIHTSFKAYVMSDICRDYIVLDHAVIRHLNIIPMQYPLPLERCNLGVVNEPQGTNQDPFFGGSVPNGFENFTPHGPMSPYREQVNVLSGDASSVHEAELGEAAPPKEVNVLCSFNVISEKAPALARINKLVQQYTDVFNTLLRKDIKIPPVRLPFKRNVEIIPSKCTSAKPTPFALMEAAKAELQTQLDLGIIARVPPDQHLEWISPAMMLEKGNSRDCRLVASAVKLNEYLDRDAYPQQSAKELVAQIPPTSKWFLTADFFKGFYQIPLHPDDQLKTTFMLHNFGLYHFKKLLQGASCSTDIFNRITDELVRDIPHCLKMVDDILFHGATIDEVLQNFTILLERCREKGFTLHPNKLAFGNKLKFAGYMVSDKGLEIDPKKVEAVRKFPKPNSVQDMKSFIGLATQFQQACPFLLGTLKPLIDATSNKVTPMFDEKHRKIKNHRRIITWNPPLEEAFLKAKQLLTNANGTVLAPYDPNLPLVIYTDASRLEGFGWLAVQEQNGAKRLIECGSSTIPDAVKKNYSVCELELHCVEMALRKMRMLTVGNDKLTVKTDHQAIIGVLAKPLEKIETRRLMKLAEKLQQYRFKIEFVSGIRNEVADAFSRNPVSSYDNDDFDTINVIVNQLNLLEDQPPLDLAKLKDLAEKDEDYQKIRQAVLNGVTARNLPPDHPARPYKPDWHLLGTEDNLVVFGERILVPKAARKDILKMLHFSHLGRQKTNALASQLYYWKGMTKEIGQLIDSCEPCQTYSNFQQKEPLQQTFAQFPMEMNSVDLASHNGKNYLIHADRYSGFLWVYALNKTTSQDVKKALWQTFFNFGFPKHLRSDNGSQFTSDFFISECKKAGIEQEWSSPLYPTSNGHSERSVAIAKDIIKKAEHPGDLQQMIMIFNASPNDSKLSPHELLNRRKLRTPLPSLTKNAGIVKDSKIAEAEDIKRKLAQNKKDHYDVSAKPLPKLAVNQRVRIYNEKTNAWDVKGTIVTNDDRTGRSYRIYTDNDMYIWRNRRFVKPISDR